LSYDAVETIAEDASGQLWVGTLGGGMNKFDPASGQFTRYQHDEGNPNSLGDDQVKIIAVEATGRLWVGTVNGLDYFDPATGQFAHYTHDPDDPHSLNNNGNSAKVTMKCHLAAVLAIAAAVDRVVLAISLRNGYKV
jgi:ligand-binding sensor domain-containing protein